jgi:hypothetical protein
VPSRTTSLVLLGLVAVAHWPAAAQDSAPTSRRERWRFHEVSDPAPSKRSIVAQASEGGDSIVVLTDGIVVYDVGKTWSSCTQPSQEFREQWVAALPPSALDRIRQAATTAKAEERELELVELLDLARVPRTARKKLLGGSAVHIEPWSERHQDSNGSWSPAAFDEHCDSLDHPICDGFGNDAFRIAATGLCSIGYSNSGRPDASDDPRNDAAKRALRYLISCQRADGGFASPGDPAAAMTDACASIALARGVFAGSRRSWGPQPATSSRPTKFDLFDLTAAARTAVSHVAASQNGDGSWGRGLDETRSLSVAAWSILAVRAGDQAGIRTDPAVVTRAVAWIERTVSAVEHRHRSSAPADVARARAIRALARAATGADATGDVTALMAVFNSDGPAALDAECLLFGTLAAWSIGNEVWESWRPVIKKGVIDTGRVRSRLVDRALRLVGVRRSAREHCADDMAGRALLQVPSHLHTSQRLSRRHSPDTRRFPPPQAVAVTRTSAAAHRGRAGISGSRLSRPLPYHLPEGPSEPRHLPMETHWGRSRHADRITLLLPDRGMWDGAEAVPRAVFVLRGVSTERKRARSMAGGDGTEPAR